ncbi:MAG TPA: DNA polymerase IV [Candidatus Ratteibacteria bacterium]|nr:DNA polymerase IV [bacterium]HRR95360.1 DNA polymerase IV [Candidatus Ratteibacteria bacterium]
MEKTIMHIDMDAYFASIEQVTNPFLKGKPIIVCGSYKTRSVVSSCSYEAKKYGIKSGMSVKQALNLCPDVIIVSGYPEKYAEVSKEIFSIIKIFTENMEIYSIDEVFLDISDIYHLYGGKKQLAFSIKKAIREKTSLPCSAGIGPNKLIAKIASCLCKPDGIKVVEKEEVEKFICDLPVDKIPGIGEKTREKLEEFGIEKCKDIRKVGKEFLVEKFGIIGEIIYKKSFGIGSQEIIKIHPPAKSIGHSYTLPFDTSNKEIINIILFKLSYKVAERMRSENKHGKVITISLRFDDFSSITKRKKFVDIPADGKVIFKIGSFILEEIKIEKRIRAIGITVGEIFDFNYDYLFKRENRREYLFHKIDDINNKFGEKTIFPAVLLLEKNLEVEKTHSFVMWKFQKKD